MNKKYSNSYIMDALRRWFIEPSPHIKELAERRQAALLSALLLSIIIVATMVELITIAIIQWDEYTGYYQTFSGVAVLLVIYLISRTKHSTLAARLSVVLVSALTFVTGWYQPRGVLGGLLDFLILPLWLASLYLSLWELFVFLILNLIGLVVFPFTTDVVTLNDILVGPFSFIFATSVLLYVITRHRNLLEKDRQQDLADREKHSREEAARTKTLLRVASRLNMHLDLDLLLDTLCEEIAKALNLRASAVALYQKRQEALVVVRGWGIKQEHLRLIPSFPKSRFENLMGTSGASFSLSNIQHTIPQEYTDLARNMDVHSMSIATMEYEHKLIGNLIGLGTSADRQFTEDELLLLKGMADQAALAIVNLRLNKDAQRRLENLQALRAIDASILKKHQLSETLGILLEKVVAQLEVDAAIALIFDRDKQELIYAAGRGLDDTVFHDTKLKIGEGLAGRAAKEKRIVYVRDLSTDMQAPLLKPVSEREGFVSYFAIPLVTQDEINGVLEIFHRSYLYADDEWFEFLDALAGQASIAIGSAILFSELQRTNTELTKAYDSTIEGWSHALDLRDKETEGHTRRVTELTLDLAKVFGFSADELVHIRRGSLLHDIGKLGVPDRILFKEASLDPEEWVLMKQHPMYALNMLQPIHYLQHSLDIPYCHHEKWDGSGYPRGLKGEEIPLAARIFAVVDVWDAVTSDRPYRAAWTQEQAFEFIRSESGKHFDPNVVEKFIHLIDQKNQHLRLRPFFRA